MGKATAESDIVEARFVNIVPGERVVQAGDFVSPLDTEWRHAKLRRMQGLPVRRPVR